MPEEPGANFEIGVFDFFEIHKDPHVSAADDEGDHSALDGEGFRHPYGQGFAIHQGLENHLRVGMTQAEVVRMLGPDGGWVVGEGLMGPYVFSVYYDEDGLVTGFEVVDHS